MFYALITGLLEGYFWVFIIGVVLLVLLTALFNAYVKIMVLFAVIVLFADFVCRKLG